MIVHNVPESTLGEAHDRKKEDIQNMTVLFNKYVGVQASVTNAIRSGKPSDRPRLFKVSLSTTEENSTFFTIGITYEEKTIQHMLINCLLHLT